MATDEPARRRFSKLPIVLGAVPGVIFGIATFFISPPEHPNDRIFFSIVYSGLVGSIGLLFGFVFALLASRRIRILDAVVIALLVLSLAAFFLSTKLLDRSLSLVFATVSAIAVIYLFVRAAVPVGRNHEQ